MEKLKEITKKVRQVLETEPRTRDSDDLLYVKVCETIDCDAVNRPFNEVITKRRELHLPPYESVSRARRKLQELHPELCAIPQVEYAREKKEEVFINYARTGGR